MPIYVYRCSHCGHQQDVLQKMSDPRLTTCPFCGHDTYEKQVTAAGFRLKGSGWYETDFRSGSGHSDGVTGAPPSHASAASSDAPSQSSSAAAGGTTGSSTPAASPG